MNTRRNLAALIVSFACVSAFASGFSLYQPSAINHAMGGALIGKAMDASANFSNPATLTDLTNIVVTLGFITEHPRGELRGTRNGVNIPESTMDSGLFFLPHFQLAVPLPYDFAFGLAFNPEFGLGTKFDEWPLAWNAKETTVQSLTLNPNLAYKITDKWSVAAGLRWMYFDFEQKKDLFLMNPALGTVSYRLKGDNGCKSLGWQVGTKYDIFDNFAVGIVYKSPIDVTVEGKTHANTESPYLASMATLMNHDADADLTLPQSVAAGFNWDITPELHLGMQISWTEWSKFDMLHFNTYPNPADIHLNWCDTWRYSWGFAWDFADDWTWMLSYVYDMDSTDSSQESTMLPPAARHIAGTGFTWRIWNGLECTLSYTCIFMHGNDMHCDDRLGNSGHYELEVSRGFCHAGGFSITYRF